MTFLKISMTKKLPQNTQKQKKSINSKTNRRRPQIEKVQKTNNSQN